MAYSADTDLLKEMSESELARLTGDSTGEEINTDRTAYARTNADALIDSYLFGRFNVPFTGTIDPIIQKISVDLTVSNLYDYAYGRSSVPSTLVWRKINAVKLLKDIQAGMVALTSADNDSQLPPPIISNKNANDRFFNDELMDQFES
ncbi:MAG: DUF1320 domain-containing protein [Bacteroidota bacterium]|jgi:phage gp36-like protein